VQQYECFRQFFSAATDLTENVAAVVM